MAVNGWGAQFSLMRCSETSFGSKTSRPSRHRRTGRATTADSPLRGTRSRTKTLSSPDRSGRPSRCSSHNGVPASSSSQTRTRLAWLRPTFVSQSSTSHHVRSARTCPGSTAIRAFRLSRNSEERTTACHTETANEAAASTIATTETVTAETRITERYGAPGGRRLWCSYGHVGASPVADSTSPAALPLVRLEMRKKRVRARVKLRRER
jgi:hypothetical protein